MEYLINRTYLYNISWEDPIVDIDVLKIKKGDDIFILTSGGDNPLTYLLKDPNSITCVDMNKHQTYLFELKRACMKVYNREDFMLIFGNKYTHKITSNWNEIKKHMSLESYMYFSSNNNKNLPNNFIYSGAPGYFYSLMYVLLVIFRIYPFFSEIKGRDFNFQRRTFESKYKKRVILLAKLIQFCLSWLSFLLGVPQKQLQLNNSSLTTETILINVCQNINFNTNYFYYGFVYGSFNDTCCMEYMKKDNYEYVKERLDRIHVFTDSVTKHLQTHTEQTYNKIILLDHLDWMEESDIIEEFSYLKKQVKKDHLIMFRSHAVSMPFESLIPLEYVKSERISYKDNENDVCDIVDRVGMYSSIHIAKIPENYNFISLLDNVTYVSSLQKDIQTLFYMYVYPILSLLTFFLTSKKQQQSHILNSFYKHQKDNYDSYRSNFLHGKKTIMQCMSYFISSRKGSKLKWLDIGGGTGDNLEYVKSNLVQFDRIDILDLCAELLHVAKDRISKLNSKVPNVIEADATSYKFDIKYDIITFSYSLTMIPDWKTAIDNAISHLEDDGFIFITDFTLFKEEQSDFSLFFWKQIFAIDNVHLTSEHGEYMSEKMNLRLSKKNYGVIPYIPYFIKAPYYVSVYSK